MESMFIKLKRKLFLMLGRAILTSVESSDGKAQSLQVTLLADETASDIERLQEYGFESYPKAADTVEALALFLNGNRNHGLVIKVHDRENRPTDLEEGDTRFYDYRGNKITCKSTGIEVEDKSGNKITTSSDGIVQEDKHGNKIESKSSELKITLGSGVKFKLNGEADNLVSFTDLDTALQNMLTALNLDIVAANGVGGTATGSTTLDISGAKLDDLKVP